MRWHLRQASAQDEEPLYEIHRAAMRDHVEAVWQWDEADQRARFREAFDPARISAVIVAGKSVGLLRLDDRGDELFLASIELAPEAQPRLGQRNHSFGLGKGGGAQGPGTSSSLAAESRAATVRAARLPGRWGNRHAH